MRRAFLDDWKDDELCVFFSDFTGSLECFDKIVKKENTVIKTKVIIITFLLYFFFSCLAPFLVIAERKKC